MTRLGTCLWPWPKLPICSSSSASQKNSLVTAQALTPFLLSLPSLARSLIDTIFTQRISRGKTVTTPIIIIHCWLVFRQQHTSWRKIFDWLLVLVHLSAIELFWPNKEIIFLAWLESENRSLLGLLLSFSLSKHYTADAGISLLQSSFQPEMIIVIFPLLASCTVGSLQFHLEFSLGVIVRESKPTKIARVLGIHIANFRVSHTF